MRTVGVITTARADYGIYLPVLRQIQREPGLVLRLFVSGMHLSPEFGMTVGVIEKDGFEITERIEMLLSSDTPEGIAKSMGLGTIGFSQAYSRTRPDILLALGDRFEMHAAVSAAVPFCIPVSHLHGGEATRGAIDESFRHSITKMSHLHFAATQAYADRIIRMGEEPWRVTVSGSPGLDNLAAMRFLSADEVRERHGLNIRQPYLLATYHPVTLEHEDAGVQMGEMLAALDAAGLPVIFTYPNADTSGRALIAMLNEYVQAHPGSAAVPNVDTEVYFTLMNHAAAIVGNSSSGIIEAASLGLPVVNIGSRQGGRIRGRNVFDVGYGRDEVLAAVRRAVEPAFRAGLAGLVNPYGDGRAAERIVERLKSVELGPGLITKRFFDGGTPA